MTTTGKAFWRTLDELADDPSFQERLYNEFPSEIEAITDPVQRRTDAQPLPQLVEQPRPAEAARVQDLDLAGVRGRDRLLWVQKPRDGGDQPGQRVAVHGLGAAEVVDHLRRGHPGDRVAFAVRQLQIRHRRPVAVASLGLPQVHPYTVSTYSLVQSSDTREVVCLQVSAF